MCDVYDVGSHFVIGFLNVMVLYLIGLIYMFVTFPYVEMCLSFYIDLLSVPHTLR